MLQNLQYNWIKKPIDVDLFFIFVLTTKYTLLYFEEYRWNISSSINLLKLFSEEWSRKLDCQLYC